MRIQAMIFDMDGTLVDSIPAVVAALQETLRRFAGRDYPPEAIIGMFGPTEEGVIAARVAPADADAAVRYYIERYEALHNPEPFPGVTGLLKRLRERGVHTGIVTGKGPGSAEVSMRVTGLDRHIETIATGSPDGAIKPRAIREMLAAWGVEPRRAAYVGDMPYDMQAAREAGVIAIGAGWAESATVSATVSATLSEDGGGRVFGSIAELEKWIISSQ